MIIDILQSKRNGLNDCIIDGLIEAIEMDEVHFVEELQEIEYEWSVEKTMKHYLADIDSSICEYDGRLYEEIQKLKAERKLIGEGDSQESIKHLIIYCSLTNRTNPFPFTTYQMIMNGEL